MSNNDGIQNVVDDDGSNALVGQIASALKGVLQQNTVLPDFSRENPSSFFSMLNTHFNVYGITEPTAKLQQLIRKIPNDLLESLDSELNAQITDEEKFEAVKLKVIKLLRKEPSQLLAKFIHAKKSPGTTYAAFLKKLQQLAKSCNKSADQDLMRLTFINSIDNPEAYNMAQALVGLEGLEAIAAKLDNTRLNNAEVFSIAKPSGDNLDLQKQVGNLATLVEKLSTKVAEVSDRAAAFSQDNPTNRFYVNTHNKSHPWQGYVNNSQGFPPTYAAGFTPNNNSDHYRGNYLPRPNNGAARYQGNRTGPADGSQQWRVNGFRQAGMPNPRPRGNGSRPPICYYHATFGINARRCMQPCYFESGNDSKNLQSQRH